MLNNNPIKKTCQKCGEPLTDNSRFCQNCGSEFEPINNFTPCVYGSPVFMINSHKNKQALKLLILSGIAIFIVVMIIMLIILG